MTTTKTDRFGGFRLKNLETMTGRETQAFNATITRDGQAVGTVSNDGNGGSDRLYIQDTTHRAAYEAVGADIKNTRDDERTEWLDANELLTVDLLDAATLNRMRRLAFLPASVTGDYWDNQITDVHVVSVRTRRTQIEMLRRTQPGCRVWDKVRCDFIPIEDL